MTFWPENPGLDELLADPIVQATMRADGVAPIALESLMKTVARRIAARRAGLLLAKPAVLPPDAVPLGRSRRPFASAYGVPMVRGGCGAASCW